MFTNDSTDPLAQFRDHEDRTAPAKPPVEGEADIHTVIEKSERAAAVDRRVRADVVEFLESATRQAAAVIQRLKTQAEALRDASIQQEMLEFIEETTRIAEDLIVGLRQRHAAVARRRGRRSLGSPASSPSAAPSHRPGKQESEPGQRPQ